MDASSLYSHCLSGTKYLVDRYQDKLKECLHFIASSTDMSKVSKLTETSRAGPHKGHVCHDGCLTGDLNTTTLHPGFSPCLRTQAEKEQFFRGARRSLGRTALCLSGGGSITMYHVGVVSLGQVATLPKPVLLPA